MLTPELPSVVWVIACSSGLKTANLAAWVRICTPGRDVAPWSLASGMVEQDSGHVAVMIGAEANQGYIVKAFTNSVSS